MATLSTLDNKGRQLVHPHRKGLLGSFGLSKSLLLKRD